jgi:hypothetical protein
MALIFDEIGGEIPLVRRVWSARCDGPTAFSSVAKSSSMMVFARCGDQVTVHVRGPETKATSMECEDGWEFFGVDLRPGAYLPMFPPPGVRDLNDAQLPTVSDRRVVLDDREWEIPTAQNVDVFVERLVRSGLLVYDPLVDNVRHDERPRSISERTAQVRFRHAMGISHRKLVSIERAQQAARLLVSGGSIIDAVVAGDYYDQPQLTRAIRWATGHTPNELRSGATVLAF